MITSKKGSMLVVLHVPHYQKNGELFLELQACHGLEMWSQHFALTTLASPKMPLELVENDKTIAWAPLNSIRATGRIELSPLPWAYSPTSFLRHLRKVRSQLRNLIHSSQYLQFSIGGLFGDWGSIAALEAYRMNKPFAAHMDGVSFQLHRDGLDKHASLSQRAKTYVQCRLMKNWNNWIASKAQLALCNGATCYDHYQQFCRQSFKIHDIHVTGKEIVSQKQLHDKKEQTKWKAPLQICYAGRMIQLKAPLDWLKALAEARDLGADFLATWYGDGPLKPTMKQEIKRLGLQGMVELPGYLNERDALMEKIALSDLFLMTHISDESPRCLIESMIKGTPILGYDSSYAKDLFDGHPIGHLFPIGDWRSLGKKIHSISLRKEQLIPMIDAAAKRGRDFTDESAFMERAQLIKEYL